MQRVVKNVCVSRFGYVVSLHMHVTLRFFVNLFDEILGPYSTRKNRTR